MTEGRHRFLHARSRVVSCVALIALTTCTARGGVRRTEPRRAVHYALADHLERAEVRHGERLVVDLGTPGGAKYTRGGWRTGFVPGSVDGTSAVTARGGTAALVLPVEFEGPGRVAIRLRVGGGGWVSFWLDGEKIRDAGVPEGQWHTVKVDLPGDLGGRGEHLLSMTYPDRLDVDGFRVGPRDATRPPSGPRKGEAPDPGWDETPPRRIDEGEAAPIVFMAPGWSLGWSFEVPEDGRFLARLRGDGRGWVKVVVEEDGRPATEVTRLLTSRKGRDVDVDLSHLEGRVVRLHLVAGGDAAARVATPRIVARHDAEERSLPPPPRNVLLFLVDTVRADALSPYAPGTRVRTPGLDAFASRSAVFSASHSQANLTKPSVATLLTSMLPWQHRAYVHSAVLSDSVVLLPEHLGPHGFHTEAIVTNGYISDQFGFRQGWDTFSHSTQTGHNRAELVADDVLAWLDERESAFEPFFLYVHTVDPHSPYDPPGDQLRLYDDRPYCGTATFDANPFLLADVREGEVQLGERDVEHLRALYDGEITYHDIHFARIVEGLRHGGSPVTPCSCSWRTTARSSSITAAWVTATPSGRSSCTCPSSSTGPASRTGAW